MMALCGWPSVLQSVTYVADPLVAEALAARMGVELCRELEIPTVMLEGDAQLIVSALMQEGEVLGRHGSIVMDARVILSGFESWTVHFV